MGRRPSAVIWGADRSAAAQLHAWMGSDTAASSPLPSSRRASGREHGWKWTGRRRGRRAPARWSRSQRGSEEVMAAAAVNTGELVKTWRGGQPRVGVAHGRRQGRHRRRQRHPAARASLGRLLARGRALLIQCPARGWRPTGEPGHGILQPEATPPAPPPRRGWAGGGRRPGLAGRLWAFAPRLAEWCSAGGGVGSAAARPAAGVPVGGAGGRAAGLGPDSRRRAQGAFPLVAELNTASELIGRIASRAAGRRFLSAARKLAARAKDEVDRERRRGFRGWLAESVRNKLGVAARLASEDSLPLGTIEEERGEEHVDCMPHTVTQRMLAHWHALWFPEKEGHARGMARGALRRGRVPGGHGEGRRLGDPDGPARGRQRATAGGAPRTGAPARGAATRPLCGLVERGAPGCGPAGHDIVNFCCSEKALPTYRHPERGVPLDRGFSLHEVLFV